MTLQEFNNLTKKYLEGRTTPAENEYFESWKDNQHFSEDTKLTDAEQEQSRTKMWSAIEKQSGFRRNFIISKSLTYAGIAASILLIIGFVISSNYNLEESGVASQERGIEVKNNSDKREIVFLADGTEVHLTKNSSISCDRDFNKTKREVYLKGEAFFKVKRDVKKLFIVHSGNLSAEVLGTSFWVKENRKNRSVEVEVTTGKVSVYTATKSRKNEKSGVILTPNQKVTFDEVSRNINQGLIENPKPIIPLEKRESTFIFKSVSLNHALKEFSEIYGIDFVVSNERLNECLITADLNNLGMYIQLDLLCKAIDAKYEKRGTVIFITGEGC